MVMTDYQLSNSTDPGPSGESGPTTSTTNNETRRFPPVAQPEIMRAAEKDDQYDSFVYNACRDAFRHLFGSFLRLLSSSSFNYLSNPLSCTGTRDAVAYQSETKLLGDMLYYVLTTGLGKQTLGEEFCDITQVSGSHGLPPTLQGELFSFYTRVKFLTWQKESALELLPLASPLLMPCLMSYTTTLFLGVVRFILQQ